MKVSYCSWIWCGWCSGCCGCRCLLLLPVVARHYKGTQIAARSSSSTSPSLPLRGLQARLQTPDFGQRTLDYGLRTTDSGLWNTYTDMPGATAAYLLWGPSRGHFRTFYLAVTLVATILLPHIFTPPGLINFRYQIRYY